MANLRHFYFSFSLRSYSVTNSQRPHPQKLELDLLVIVFILRHINNVFVHVAGIQLFFLISVIILLLSSLIAHDLWRLQLSKTINFQQYQYKCKSVTIGVTSIVTICCSKSRCSLYANNNGPCALERPWRDSPTRKCPLLGSALYYYIGRAEVIRFRYHRAHYSIQKSSICTQRKRAGIDSNLVSTKNRTHRHLPKTNCNLQQEIKPN